MFFTFLCIYWTLNGFKHIRFSLCLDPCDAYTEINNTELTTSYTLSSPGNNSCMKIPPFKWYRYTGTEDGLMSTDCPSGLQCGTDVQIWLNDTVPGVADGEVYKRVCTHSNDECCKTENRIRTKNCSFFIIYFLIPTLGCSQYCYESQIIPDDSSISREEQKPFEKLWIIAVCLPVILCLVFIAVMIWKYCYRPLNHQIINENFVTVSKPEMVLNRRFNLNRIKTTN